MSSKAKAKGKGISAGSFLDLKAELSKQEDELARNKAAGKPNYIVGGVKRPDKKPTVWARQNKGVSARASRDIELEAISKPTLESARAALERKAKIYDKLKKGQTGGLNDKQYESLLVDFDSKPSDHYESDSDDVDESVEVARPLVDDDDPIVEYEDEFGRIRTARRSEVPRNLARPAEPEVDEDEDLIIRNPVGHFPVYQPSADRVEQIEKDFSEANNPLGVHYDASAEVQSRQKRRGKRRVLWMFSPGEVEGMQDPGSGGKSRAMEKRKRELEERRKMLDAKRRKLATGKDSASTSTTAQPDTAVFTATARPDAPVFAAVADDPFAALEVVSNSKGKAKAQPVENDADKFLAQLEQEFLGGKRK
ncbi:hypothetical protein MVEN_02490000 [Mycena venus]|uniref:Uncharacterized protein n=1 Tax=Mycena venus TaxID=2733690 RepID=A0A8H7CAR8_9AGAR|nr:hypothetical protein MVEN_02490000 [Mycena venus]